MTQRSPNVSLRRRATSASKSSQSSFASAKSSASRESARLRATSRCVDSTTSFLIAAANGTYHLERDSYACGVLYGTSRVSARRIANEAATVRARARAGEACEFFLRQPWRAAHLQVRRCDDLSEHVKLTERSRASRLRGGGRDAH